MPSYSFEAIILIELIFHFFTHCSFTSVKINIFNSFFFQIFNVQTLDLKAVGNSFGFVSPPHIDLGVGVSKKMAREGKKHNHKDQKKSKIFRQGKPKGLVQFAR